MNWGTRIVIAFTGFVALIVTLVVISMRQDVNLVADDYYKQEIAYQQHMQKVQNHLDMDEHVTINLQNEVLVLNAPLNENVIGEVHFFRPSDSNLDQKFKLKLTKSQQFFDRSKFQSGLWKVKVSWEEDGKYFYTEETVIL